MLYRAVGQFQVSRLGLGCSAAWCKSWFPQKKAVSLVARAVELGVTCFDTGPSYGDGEAERRLGQAMREYGSDAQSFFLSTKVGSYIDGRRLQHNFSPKFILRSMHDSLNRLERESVPMVWLHGPRKLDINDEVRQCVLKLKEQGLISWIGVNSFDMEVIDFAVNTPWVDAIMPEFNFAQSLKRDAMRAMVARGGFVISGVPFANMAHAPRFLVPRTLADIWYSARFVKNAIACLPKAHTARLELRERGLNPVEHALDFVFKESSVTASIFGTTRIEHLEQNILSLHRVLNENTY